MKITSFCSQAMNEDTSQALCRSSQALHVSITVFEGVSDKWHQVPLAVWWLPIACQKCADCPNVPNTYTTMQVDSSEFPDASRSWGEPRSSQHTTLLQSLQELWWSEVLLRRSLRSVSRVHCIFFPYSFSGLQEKWRDGFFSLQALYSTSPLCICNNL